jgi:NADP-dependent 3-hydroxy acid dehydrogenase YdfG
MAKLEVKVAVITGGGSGIGAATRAANELREAYASARARGSCQCTARELARGAQ